MDRINLDLDAGDALTVHGALIEKSTRAWATYRRLVETNAPDLEQSVALTMAQAADRVSARISAQLYPECSFWQGCELAVRGEYAGKLYCAVHMPATAAAFAS